MTERDEEYKYAVVGKKIHKYPAWESCNLDSANRSGNRGLRAASFRERIPALIRPEVGYTLCLFCFPEGLTDEIGEGGIDARNP